MGKTAYTNVNIIDGLLNKDKKMTVRKGTVVVENGVFTSVFAEEADLKECRIVDLDGAYMMPGLINLHVRLPLSGGPTKPVKENQKPTNYKKLFDTLTKFKIVIDYFRKVGEKNVKAQLYSGVTTLRSVGGILDIDGQVRDKVNSGKADGPRMLVANTAISVTGGHFAGSLATESDTPEQAVKDLLKVVETKPDIIKLMVTGGVMDAEKEGEPGVLRMRPEIIKAVCDKAHELGFKVAAHVESPEGMKAALLNGVDTIEHGAEPDDEMISLYEERNAAHVCTISPALPGALFDEKLRVVNSLGRKNSLVVMKGVINCAKKCIENNIPVGLGTDSGCPYTTQYNTWRELDFFSKCLNVSRDFALYTATTVNAKIIGLDKETGSIENGKSADFIVCRNNPLEDGFKVLEKLEMVSVRGKVINNPKVKRYPKAEAELDRIAESL